MLYLFFFCSCLSLQEIADSEARLEGKLLERQSVQESLSELIKQVRAQQRWPQCIYCSVLSCTVDAMYCDLLCCAALYSIVRVLCCIALYVRCAALHMNGLLAIQEAKARNAEELELSGIVCLFQKSLPSGVRAWASPGAERATRP